MNDQVESKQWDRYYEKRLTKNQGKNKNLKIELENTEHDSQVITTEEIKKELMGMKSNKAPGCGGIPI